VNSVIGNSKILITGTEGFIILRFTDALVHIGDIASFYAMPKTKKLLG